MRVKFVYLSLEVFNEVIMENIRLVFIEVVINLILKVIDVFEVIRWVKEVGVMVVVDNIFFLLIFKLLKVRVDGVIYSFIKYIVGYNDVMGGVLIWGDFDFEDFWYWRRRFGLII